jgi:Transposase DDE domain/Domain of unknown function (DUF4372)
MNQGKFVFAQISSFLSKHVFENCVNRYNGNHWVHQFSCWNQLMCMMFGQLSGRDSLRDLTTSLNAHKPKFYHLGLGRNISKSNLAYANEKRSYQIFEDYAYYLVGEARKCCMIDDAFLQAFEGPVYAFDSTIVDLCLSVFWWATFRRAKGGIKLHTQLDLKTNIPCFIHLTPADVHDVNGLDEVIYETNGFYILDRGYIDYYRLHKIHQHEAFFVVRTKNNLRFDRLYSKKCNNSANIRCDQIIKLHGYYSSMYYPEKLRRIKFYDQETDTMFVFMTNNMDLKAEEIAALYKYRWKIELFFKWIKQHLKIKSFWGTTENAVKIQVYIAIICFAVVSIIKSKLSIEKSTYEILQILSISLLDKTPLNELLTNFNYQNVKEPDCNQLNIFKFI